jgi:hypothetical protein
MMASKEATIDRYPKAVTGHDMVITRRDRSTLIEFEPEPGWIDPHSIGETKAGRERNAKQSQEE